MGPEGFLLFVATLGLAVGGSAWLAGASRFADAAWAVTTMAAFVPAAAWVFGALRERRLGVDVIAVFALVGTLAVGEPLAGAVIAVMLGTGRVLETRASRRAAQELTALLS